MSKYRLPTSWAKPSLLAIPLLRHALSDPNVTIRLRGADRRWYYERVIPLRIGGFNPYRRAVYVCAESALASWLAAGCVDDREFNEADFLMHELLMLVHDYLHCWAVVEIQRLMPELGFGTAPLDRENFEAMVFCHLLTEAVATVGLDYWYLSTVDLNEVTDVGTCLKTLTVSYHEGNLREYRRFHPTWDMQSVEGFARLARFYCTGQFPGFSLEDLRRSARLHAWLKHEISYGVNQRAYTRQWLAHLSNGAVEIAYADSKGPVACEAEWQRALIEAVGERLWVKVKRDEPPSDVVVPCGAVWQREVACPDFRFVNINALTPEELARFARHEDARRYFDLFYSQYISRCLYGSVPAERIQALRGRIRDGDVAGLVALVDDPAIAKFEPAAEYDEPLDLMFLN